MAYRPPTPTELLPPETKPIPKRDIDELRRQSDASVFFFARAILGFDYLRPEVHGELCGKLQNLFELHRLLVSGFRSCGKTTCTQSAILWHGLTKIDLCGLLIEQRLENAEMHIAEMQRLMKQNPLFLQVYKDRIPPGFAGWNTQTIVFNRKSPRAKPFLRIAGLPSKLESQHYDFLWCNDLEGADADISDAPNRDSENFLFSRADPLLNSPDKPILVEGTPHGQRPLVWKLRRLEEWHKWWLPVHDENRRPTMPWYYGDKHIDRLYEKAKISRAAQRQLDQQYLLREHTSVGGQFAIEQIRSMCYEFERGSARMIRYPAIVLQKKDPWSSEEPEPTVEWRNIDLSCCRYYIHADAKHKDETEKAKDSRPSVASIVVVGVTPDFHMFVADYWEAPVGNLGEQMKNYVRLYEKWGCYGATYEAVAAQVWFKDAIEQYERAYGKQYRARLNVANRTSRRLPMLSSRLEESHKANTPKEIQIIGSLEFYFDLGLLHLHASQTSLLHQLQIFPSDSEPIDGIDALAQGPTVWQPPLSDEYRDVLRKRRDLIAYMRGGESPSVYNSPFDLNPSLGAIIERGPQTRHAGFDASAWEM